MLSFRNISAARRVGVEPRGSIAVPRTAGIGKGFGCRPGASGIPGKRAGVRKPPKNEPAEKR
jgi:hypothetical protein